MQPSVPITAMQAAQSEQRVLCVILRLLRALKPFIEAYPVDPAAEMTDHDIVWVTKLGGGPERVVLDAMMAHPELWVQALPPEVCIVPRTKLDSLGISADSVSALAEQGAYMVAAHAAAEEKRRASQ